MNKRNGMILVSGCPRSGTSVCMDIQRAAHGSEKILGEKFPQEARKARREKLREYQENEPVHEYRIRQYMIDKAIASENANQSEDEQRWRDMNPEGFWEMAFSVRGIIYHPQFKDTLKGVLEGETKICKVVSQGLLMSDPQYIGKIIFMIRHPRAVAKSQERLVRGFNFRDETDGKVKNIFEGMKIHTPEMFIGVTTQAARFFLDNPEIPVRFYHFEKLIEDPIPYLDDMQKFVGEGDYKKACNIVQPKLNRSKHEDVENKLWGDAYFIYDKLCEAAELINNDNTREEANTLFKEILEYMEDPKREYNREKRQWRCYRAKHTVTEDVCRSCYYNSHHRENFKIHSESTEGKVSKHWTQEPCLFECGMDLDRDPDDYLTIEESIENNFWETGIHYHPNQ